jgi:STE24 endopeptidase
MASILYTLYQLITTIYEAYDTFRTETKFGFNKITVKLFVKDQLIDYIVTGLILLIGINVLLFLYQNLDTTFLIYGGIFISILLILYHVFFIIVFIPIMYESKPLENQEINDNILLLAQKEHFNINQIVSINASKRTTKINAYFSGFGKQKKVMIFDTMQDKLTVKQITAVIAHEVGHSKYNHMLKDLIKDIIIACVYLGLFYILLIQDTSLLTSNDNSFISSVVSFVVLLGPIQIFLKTFTNVISRRHEKSADLYVKEMGFGTELSECLLLAAKSNLGNLYPHPLFVFFKFDHPSLLQRLSYLK